MIVAGEHAGIDQEDSSSEGAADSRASLDGVADHNSCGFINCKDFFRFLLPLFLLPLIITAKPQGTILTDAQPTAESQKLSELFDACVIRGRSVFAFGD